MTISLLVGKSFSFKNSLSNSTNMHLTAILSQICGAFYAERPIKPPKPLTRRGFGRFVAKGRVYTAMICTGSLKPLTPALLPAYMMK